MFEVNIVLKKRNTIKAKTSNSNSAQFTHALYAKSQQGTVLV
jgi:hypothetical protein